MLALLVPATAPAAADDAASARIAEATDAGLTDGSVNAFGWSAARLSTGKRIELDAKAAGKRRLQAFDGRSRRDAGIYRQIFLALDGGASEKDQPDVTAPLRPAAIAAVSPTNTAPQVRWLAVKGAVAYRIRRDEQIVGEVKERPVPRRRRAGRRHVRLHRHGSRRGREREPPLALGRRHLRREGARCAEVRTSQVADVGRTPAQLAAGRGGRPLPDPP